MGTTTVGVPGNIRGGREKVLTHLHRRTLVYALKEWGTIVDILHAESGIYVNEWTGVEPLTVPCT